jgi:hypothetical protein
MKSLLHAAAALLIAAAASHGQKVTATAKVEIDGRVETVRKINGRWWATDNRQLTPTKQGFIWWISSEKGHGWDFHHHRPVRLELAESLHLFMDPGSVESVLGEPNQTAPVHEGRGEDSPMWYYYAENGTALFVRFIRNQLADARYERADFGVHGKPVETVAQELGGRNIFKIMADQAAEQNSKAHPLRGRAPSPRPTGSRSSGSITVVTTAQADAPRQDRPRIPQDKADGIKEGMTRAEVVKIMGEASGGLSVAGAEVEFETLTYALDPSGEIAVRLEKGKVVKITR